MHRSAALSVVSALVTSLAATAQESQCNPCADPPSRDDCIIYDAPRNGDFTCAGATVVVTAEDMRRLGITTAADLSNQLTFLSATPLGNPERFPPQFAPVFEEATTLLQNLGYDPRKFSARLVMCPDGNCTLVIYPAEFGVASVETVRECPAGYCATLTYSLPDRRVLAVQRHSPTTVTPR
jgi:hypothetical protein